MGKMQETVIAVIRTFQRGEDQGTFDAAEFSLVREAIATLLSLAYVRQVCIVTPVGEGRFAERVDARGVCPTQIAVSKAFPSEMRTGHVRVEIVERGWGDNPGSPGALNLVVREGTKGNDSFVLSWSPELLATKRHFDSMYEVMLERRPTVCGLLRDGWLGHIPWMVPQNTCAIWDIARLIPIRGFDPQCGIFRRSVAIEGGETAPLAGREDFHACLRMLDRGLSWVMVGVHDPAPFRLVTSSDARRAESRVKTLRQYAVMRAYIGDLFPGATPEEVLDRFWRCGVYLPR